MSYLIRTISYNLKTGEKKVIKEEVKEGYCRADETLIRILAEGCVKEFREKQRQEGLIKKGD